ncbi:MAG TPA: hypothetical protein VGM01_11395 [Ktedonobacteraceae bacterium]
MYLNSRSRYLIWVIVGIALLMIVILGFHPLLVVALSPYPPLEALLADSLYSQLFGALLGGSLAIVSVNMPIRFGEEAEPWLGRERLAWTLIGAGAILWGLGEVAYRYELAHNLPNFPAISDIGYSALPPLVFLGLILQPDSESGRGRLLVLLDSLISMGAILAIAWFLLLGSMAQTPNEDNLARFLGLYYPVTDMALLSCVVFLVLRGGGRVYGSGARRLGLLLVGLGICVFAVSDFNYNVQNNMSTYVDGTWADLGWPLGLLLIGIAAHLRRFMLSTPGNLIEERVRRREERTSFGVAQLLPYILLGTLLLVLVINVLSNDKTQIWNRPVLLFATVGVVALLVVRQLITQLENERLSRRQLISLERLAAANARVEEQARAIAEHNANLEEGIAHLKEVQAQIANGNMRARARISSGNLVSLAGSLNLMTDRLLRFDQVDMYVQKLTRALNELSHAFDLYRTSGRFALPPICNEFPEIQRLLISIGMKPNLQSGGEQAQTTLSQQSAARAASSPLADFNSTRSASKPLAGSNNIRPSSSPLTNRPNSSPLTNRSPSSPLASSDQRIKGNSQRFNPNASGAWRSNERPELEPSDLEQIEFPPLTGWGSD